MFLAERILAQNSRVRYEIMPAENGKGQDRALPNQYIVSSKDSYFQTAE